MRKAVAIPYVIALILGIVVVGLIGYWFISQGGKTVGSGEQAKCDADRFKYCLEWKNKNNFNTPDPTGYGFTGCRPATEPLPSECRQLLNLPQPPDILQP